MEGETGTHPCIILNTNKTVCIFKSTLHYITKLNETQLKIDFKCKTCILGLFLFGILQFLNRNNTLRKAEINQVRVLVTFLNLISYIDEITATHLYASVMKQHRNLKRHHNSQNLHSRVHAHTILYIISLYFLLVTSTLNFKSTLPIFKG